MLVVSDVDVLDEEKCCGEKAKKGRVLVVRFVTLLQTSPF